MGYRSHLHLLINAIMEDEIVRDGNPVGFHGMFEAVVKVSHIGIVEIGYDGLRTRRHLLKYLASASSARVFQAYGRIDYIFRNVVVVVVSSALLRRAYLAALTTTAYIKTVATSASLIKRATSTSLITLATQWLGRHEIVSAILVHMLSV